MLRMPLEEKALFFTFPIEFRERGKKALDVVREKNCRRRKRRKNIKFNSK
jgi:hypothetical protein